MALIMSASIHDRKCPSFPSFSHPWQPRAFLHKPVLGMTAHLRRTFLEDARASLVALRFWPKSGRSNRSRTGAGSLWLVVPPFLTSDGLHQTFSPASLADRPSQVATQCRVHLGPSDRRCQTFECASLNEWKEKPQMNIFSGPDTELDIRTAPRNLRVQD